VPNAIRTQHSWGHPFLNPHLSPHTCVHAYIETHMHTCVYTYACIYICTCAYAPKLVPRAHQNQHICGETHSFHVHRSKLTLAIYTVMYIYTRVHIHTLIHICIPATTCANGKSKLTSSLSCGGYAYVYECMYVCICTRVHMYIIVYSKCVSSTMS